MNVIHSLIHCPAYAVPRQTLIQSLNQIPPDDLFIFISKKILCGSNVLILSDNLTILKLIQDGIV